MAASASDCPHVKKDWTAVHVEVRTPGVAHVFLDRSPKLNAMNPAMFSELTRAASMCDTDDNIRVVILQGRGAHFCAGIDLTTFDQIVGTGGGRSCEGRRREKLLRDIEAMQAAYTAFEFCRKPVIAAVQGVCIGAGVDLITACDIRYCTKSAKLSVKEVDLAITADLGVLQRMPLIVGDGVARELAFTARMFSGEEAQQMGLVSRAFDTEEDMMRHVNQVAEELAAKSPLALAGTKATLLHRRGRTVEESLKYVAMLNSAQLISKDLTEAFKKMQKPMTSRL